MAPGSWDQYASPMQRLLPPEALARDDRFHRITTAERFADTRPGVGEERRMDPKADEVADRARRQMHGIFVGEIQALEGAGRTAFDYATATSPGVADGVDTVPFALKLDMARQRWDEARHVEISVKLGDHMGTQIGEYSEAVTLFEAACHPDPVFRLAGVNRALEGLAIDVFTTMRDFADDMADPVLRFAEDWMLADEVTHVKMGSTWLREVTKDDADRRQRALEFQKTVDGLFNFRGLRGEDEESAIRLARRFRELAGFDTAEIDAIAEQAAAQRAERMAAAASYRFRDVPGVRRSHVRALARTVSTCDIASRSWSIHSPSWRPTSRTHHASASLRLRAMPASINVSSTPRSPRRRRVMAGTLATVNSSSRSPHRAPQETFRSKRCSASRAMRTRCSRVSSRKLRMRADRATLRASALRSSPRSGNASTPTTRISS